MCISTPTEFVPGGLDFLAGETRTVYTPPFPQFALARVQVMRNGEVIATLADAQPVSSTMRWSWDGTSEAGAFAGAGSYTARITVSLPDGTQESRETPFVLR